MFDGVAVRKFVHYEEEMKAQVGVEPVRRSIAGAVLVNPLSGSAESADLEPLRNVSVVLGAELTRRALSRLGDPKILRAYGKAAVVGSSGLLEHSAAAIHDRLGMVMRSTIRRGRVSIPGNAKIGAPGTSVDVVFGPIDDGWDLDAVDTVSVHVADSPRANEILLLVGYSTGPRPDARSRGPQQHEVNALLASFGSLE